MDVITDTAYRILYKVATALGDDLPDYVRSHEPPDKEAAAAMPDSDFADDFRRLYPLDSKAATWLSAAYFLNSDTMPYGDAEKEAVWSVIKSAAAEYGISDDIDKLSQAFVESVVEKNAADSDSNWAWVVRDKVTGDVVSRRYPIFDARGVKLASDYFTANRAKYPAAVRKHIASNIMRKSSEHGAQVSAAVMNEAGYGIPSRAGVMSAVLERAKLAGDADTAAVFANANEVVAAVDSSELPAVIDKLAEVFDVFDRAAGLCRGYGKSIMFPADEIYSGDVEKAAADIDDCVEIGGFTFSLAKLAELPASAYETALGPEFVKAVFEGGSANTEKLADNLHSLPVPDQNALVERLTRL